MLVCRRHMSYCQHLKAWRHTLTQAPPRTPGRMRHRDGGGDGDWGFNFKILVHYNNILFLSSLSHGSWLYHYLTHIWIWVTCHRCWAVKLNQDSSKKSRCISNRCHPDVTHADVVSGPTSPRIRGYKVKGLVGWLSVRSQECHWNGSPPDRELHLYIFLVFGGKNLLEYACIQNMIRCWSCCKCKGSMYDSNVSSCWKTFNSISWRLTLKVSLNVSRVQAQCVAGTPGPV